MLNILTVRHFGISEFYLSIFKILLMLGLMMYTFVTMVGGNPRHDPYGFRYWKDQVYFMSPTIKLWLTRSGRLCVVSRLGRHWSILWSVVLHDPGVVHVGSAFTLRDLD